VNRTQLKVSDLVNGLSLLEAEFVNHRYERHFHDELVLTRHALDRLTHVLDLKSFPRLSYGVFQSPALAEGLPPFAFWKFNCGCGSRQRVFRPKCVNAALSPQSRSNPTTVPRRQPQMNTG
jgi:hypothetical protein